VVVRPKCVRTWSQTESLSYSKMNIPLDARTPSYDDTGDSAMWNIPTVWDFSFWQGHLDAMARHRYNALTLWNPHPFPSLVKLPDFPEVAMAWLGQYYADKIRGATALAQYRQSKDRSHKQAAVEALTAALQSWRRYADLAASLYRPQVLARAQELDWQALTKDVEKELERVRSESVD